MVALSAARVLVVEDDAEYGALMLTVLRQEGCEAAMAGPFDAVAAAVKMQPHVVLLDYRMPPTNGGVVLAAIRETLPAVPAIMVTALHNAAEVAEALGIHHCLRKPFDLVDLTTMLAVVLDTLQ